MFLQWVEMDTYIMSQSHGYNPIVKSTPFIVSDTEGDKGQYYEDYAAGKYNPLINKFGNSSAILFKKRLLSFVPKNK